METNLGMAQVLFDVPKRYNVPLDYQLLFMRLVDWTRESCRDRA